jgi:hypothetical protein
MKILYLVPALAVSAWLQQEFLDLTPLIQIMADAPVYAIFVWLFFLQQKQNDRLTRAIIQLSGRKSAASEEEE